MYIQVCALHNEGNPGIDKQMFKAGFISPSGIVTQQGFFHKLI